jgi:hypothetical protein
MKNVIILILLLSFNTLHLLNAQDIDTAAVCPTPEERDNNSLLTVFPNPSNGTFQIVYASTTTCPPAGWGGVLMVNIINSNGKTVYSESISNFEGEYNKIIDLNTQEKGVFIIEVVSGRQKKVKREVLN